MYQLDVSQSIRTAVLCYCCVSRVSSLIFLDFIRSIFNHFKINSCNSNYPIQSNFNGSNLWDHRYSRLSLSRTQRDSLKYFEISVVRHIRFAELRKK